MNHFSTKVKIQKILEIDIMHLNLSRKINSSQILTLLNYQIKISHYD
jgi:hypothetical protein